MAPHDADSRYSLGRLTVAYKCVRIWGLRNLRIKNKLARASFNEAYIFAPMRVIIFKQKPPNAHFSKLQLIRFS